MDDESQSVANVQTRDRSIDDITRSVPTKTKPPTTKPPSASKQKDWPKKPQKGLQRTLPPPPPLDLSMAARYGQAADSHRKERSRRPRLGSKGRDIKMDQFTLSFHGRLLIEGGELSEGLTILGANGTGKSTLLKFNLNITGSLPPSPVTAHSALKLAKHFSTLCRR
ncbi:hypothetical protein D9758_016914 [Tetrapyrgos nigripes]|uniref:ABC transporter domain-containing protein n=1 Tax=Tetrapyrgos nigripes TaxID=182062 RepID=A0A8H5C5M8_9AGAR|nr:hypothetical protein D9758_016914 [Tetrapyrgos nigripes]